MHTNTREHTGTCTCSHPRTSMMHPPPPQVRPSVMMDSSARCEDDLTHKLIEIVRANNHLRRQLSAGTAQHLLNDFVAMLQVGAEGWTAHKGRRVHSKPRRSAEQSATAFLGFAPGTCGRSSDPHPCLSPLFALLTVPHHHVHGQHAARPAARAAEERAADQEHLAAPQGQAGAHPRQPDGQARRLQRAHGHHRCGVRGLS